MPVGRHAADQSGRPHGGLLQQEVKFMFRTLLCLLILLPVSVLAQISPQQLDELASEAQPQVVQWRRWFHENPELSNREFNTSARVARIRTDIWLPGYDQRPGPDR
jgi:hypothetical protein